LCPFFPLERHVTKNYLRKPASIARQNGMCDGAPSSDDLMKTLFGRTVYVIKMIGRSVALLL
jgi:hypothetical protein